MTDLQEVAKANKKLEDMEKEELVKLCTVYGQALNAICYQNPNSSFIIPYFDVPAGILAVKPLPIGLLFSYHFFEEAQHGTPN